MCPPNKPARLGSGAVGAAATMIWLMGYRDDAAFHFQASFASGRARALKMACEPICECQGPFRTTTSSWALPAAGRSAEVGEEEQQSSAVVFVAPRPGLEPCSPLRSP